MVVENGVTSICIQAFYDCNSLNSVTLPDSVTSIGYYAFEDCSSLTSITIPDGVTTIGDSTFEGCNSLTSVTLPDSVTTIGYYAFEDCSSLTSINIPDGVTSIGNSAFSGCVNLCDITIPDSVTVIGGYAFEDCQKLNSITIPGSVTTVGQYAFISCTSLAEVVLEDGVQEIEIFAFYGCTRLRSITLPDSITRIRYNAFDRCDALQNIYYGGTAAQWDKVIIGAANDALDQAIFQCKELPVTGIALNTAPMKTTYQTGERLNTAGLSLTVSYSDGSTATVSSGFETSGFSSALAGEKTVTVTYKGFTATFAVTVEETAVDANAPQIFVESKKVTKGSTFTVNVWVKNNPGFSYLELTRAFSPELTLVDVANGQLIADFTTGNQYIWVAEGDMTADGVLMRFTFRVDNTVALGTYQIGFQVRTCGNDAEETVELVVVAANIEVTDCVYGDATGDGLVDGMDVIRLKKYLANYNYDTETSTIEIADGADATGDGVVDGFDVIRLKKYLANYDYETGESTIPLGPQ